MPVPPSRHAQKMRHVRVLALSVLCSVLWQRADAQTPSAITYRTARNAPLGIIRDTVPDGAVKVYVDCQSMGCDYDFFRDELRWANFVRDRLLSDVLLLVTSLRTGAGGSEYTIAAIGQDRFKGRADTAIIVAEPNDASDVVRRRLARTFGLLLAPYAARTPYASKLSMSYTAPALGSVSGVPAKDRWNYWVYRASVNGFSSGEKQQSSSNGFASVSANRVTKELKISTDANLGYSQSRFDLGDGTIFTNIQRNYGADVLVAKSVNNHVSAGLTANYSFSDYSNYKSNIRVAPAIEWDLFDYKDFTRRQLTAYYSIGINAVRYQDTTIYNRIEETRPQHGLTVAWNARQPWGSVNMSVYGSQFLHNLSYNSYGVSGFFDLRIAKGLALNIGGNYSRVNDQLYLRKGALSDNQVIARQQALATNYRYFMNFGLSYTFGSISNSVVNPRFGGGGGGGRTIQFF